MQKISLALVTALVILIAAPARAQTPAPTTYLQQLEGLNAAREAVSEMRHYVERTNYGARNCDTLIETAEKAFKHLDEDLHVMPPINLLNEYGDMRLKVREKGVNDAFENLVYYGRGWVTNDAPEMIMERLHDAIAKARKEGVNTVAKEMLIPYHLNRAYFQHVHSWVNRVERKAEGIKNKHDYYSAHYLIHHANVAIVAALKAGVDVDDLRIRLVEAQDQACSRDDSCKRPLTYFEQ